MDDIKESVRQAGIALARWGCAAVGQGADAEEWGSGSKGGADCLSPPHELLTLLSAFLVRPRCLLPTRPPTLPPRPPPPLSLFRTVRGLTLRLADKELTPAAQGRQAVGVALPLLLEKGE